MGSVFYGGNRKVTVEYVHMKGAFTMNDLNLLNPQQLALTDAAKARFLSQIPEGTAGIRMALSKKGCGGNMYDYKIVEAGGEDVLDLYVELGAGKKLFIPPMDFFTGLSGSIIDFTEDDLGNQNIRITNPNVKGACGCGESFTL
jgi:iron-sulfur cluster assembly protein